MSDVFDQIRRYWDAGAIAYDSAIDHQPRTRIEWAVWTATLARRLPTDPCRVLDVGAGTGFLSLIAARLGHHVTALDLSGVMLDRIRDKAQAEGLSIELVQARADRLPDTTWDAVVSRHLVWTLPDPLAALRAWRAAAPAGRLVLVDWSDALGHPLSVGVGGRRLVWIARRILKTAPTGYSQDLRARLPLQRGPSPDQLVSLLVQAGWNAPRLERLADVDWIMARELSWPSRLVGLPPRFLVWAD